MNFTMNHHDVPWYPCCEVHNISTNQTNLNHYIASFPRLNESPMCGFNHPQFHYEQVPSPHSYCYSHRIPFDIPAALAWSNHSRLESAPVPDDLPRSILTNWDVGASGQFTMNRIDTFVRMFTYPFLGMLGHPRTTPLIPPDERLRIQKAHWSHWDQCSFPKVFAPDDKKLRFHTDKSSTNVVCSIDGLDVNQSDSSDDCDIAGADQSAVDYSRTNT